MRRAALEASFRATTYRVTVPEGFFCLRIGVAHPAFDSFLLRRAAARIYRWCLLGHSHRVQSGIAALRRRQPARAGATVRADRGLGLAISCRLQPCRWRVLAGGTELSAARRHRRSSELGTRIRPSRRGLWANEGSAAIDLVVTGATVALPYQSFHHGCCRSRPRT